MAIKSFLKKYKNRISTGVIVLGVVIFLAAGIYWAAGYPWPLLFSRLGWAVLSDDLPDPAPISVELLTDQWPEEDTAAETGLPDPVDWNTVRPQIYMVQLGVIKLPKIGIAENVVEGSDSELLYAVGHVRGTAMPGEAGNCVLAGHRNYIRMNPFRHLDKMDPGDPVLVKDEVYQYTYEVYEVFQVGPGDAWVMDEREDEKHMLTLVTCTPVMNPTNRLIVWCRLAGTEELPQE